ncbi:MAG: hypothetical protein R3D02_08725 [Hyphomicrobiales bacterium]
MNGAPSAVLAFAAATVLLAGAAIAQNANPWAPSAQNYVPSDPQMTGNVFASRPQSFPDHRPQAAPPAANAPGYPAPGYGAPNYGAPGYAAPGYGPGYGMPAYGPGYPGGGGYPGYGYPAAPFGGVLGGFSPGLGGFSPGLGGAGFGPGYGGFGPYADPFTLATPGFAAPWVLAD